EQGARGMTAAWHAKGPEYPGEVVEIEYEIESNGDASYEIDILTDKGEIKLEVDPPPAKSSKTIRRKFTRSARNDPDTPLFPGEAPNPKHNRPGLSWNPLS
ncbi:MAG: hypothetical protein ACU841_16705, partial [Gammaproteobacteria bacterium]